METTGTERNRRGSRRVASDAQAADSSATGTDISGSPGNLPRGVEGRGLHFLVIPTILLIVRQFAQRAIKVCETKPQFVTVA